MYKVILIDDEPLIRQGLKAYLVWEDYGFTIIGEAEDGTRGLDICRQLQPDLVITDIRMPGISGIELINQLKDDLVHTRFIILSGYNEFELAQQAIRAGASDYILKPLQKEQFTQTIHFLKNELDRCHDNVIFQQQLARMLERNISLLKNNLVSELLEGKISESSKEEALFFKMNSECFTVVLWDYTDDTLDIKAVENCRGLLPSETREIVFYYICQYMIQNGLHWHLGELNKLGVFLICGAMKDQELHYHLCSLADEILRKTGIALFISLGKTVFQFEDIPQSFQEAQKNMENLFYHQKIQIFDSPLIFSSENLISRYLNSETESLIFSAIENGDQTKIDTILGGITKLVFQEKYSEPDRVRELFSEILTKVFLRFKESSIIAFDIRTAIKTVAEMKTYNQLFEFTEGLLSQQSNLLGAEKSEDSKKIIKEIRKFLQENLTQEISLNSIATKFHLNLYYLSHLFKKETGFNFIDYLTSLRIEKAKELLEDVNYKIYEIASKVGYDDQRYFSQVFKKYTGYTPKEYRNKRG